MLSSPYASDLDEDLELLLSTATAPRLVSAATENRDIGVTALDCDARGKTEIATTQGLLYDLNHAEAV
jgi:hypothetical protein